jgi:hypothetical protein
MSEDYSGHIRELTTAPHVESLPRAISFYCFAKSVSSAHFPAMSPRPADEHLDPRMALVRAVETYPENVYSDIDSDAKQEADEDLFGYMKAFLANNGWDKFVSLHDDLPDHIEI